MLKHIILPYFIVLSGIQGFCNNPDTLFTDIQGMEKTIDPVIFSRDNLYEAINGAAEVFLAYDFCKLYRAEYFNNMKNYVQAEIYEYNTQLDAFGIYSLERQTDYTFIDVGIQGYTDGTFINFLADNYYVKITGHNLLKDQNSLVELIAKSLADNIETQNKFPEILSCFPKDKKIDNSEKYYAENFLMYDFLGSGYIADYSIDNKGFQLFVMECGNFVESKEAFSNLLKINKKDFEELRNDSVYTLNDSNYGNLFIVLKGNILFGIINLEDEFLAMQYINNMEIGIRNYINSKSYVKDNKERIVHINGYDIELVYIPHGEFVMGSPANEEGRFDEEGPQRLVEIKSSFWMGKFEVTNGLWIAVKGESRWISGDKDMPRTWIGWKEALNFIKALNSQTGLSFRLPTEAEWEYACRAGTTTPFGYGESLGANQANFNGTYPYGNAEKGAFIGETCAVGKYQPNNWGLYDMHGNVWEWCEDLYLEDIYSRTDLYSVNSIGNPVYSEEGLYHVIRGGGWLGNGNQARSACRANNRYGQNYIGFRLVLDEK